MNHATENRSSTDRIGSTILGLMLMISTMLAQSPGELDTTFNSGDDGSRQLIEGFNSTISGSAIQPNGKIVLIGNFFISNDPRIHDIARFEPNGKLDTTLNTQDAFNGTIYCHAIQLDGKILVGGYFTQYDTISRNRIARLNSDGSLDTSFDPLIGPNNRVSKMLLQPDGKVVIQGTFDMINGTPSNGLARLNSDGSLDNTFDNTTANTNLSGSIRGLDLQQDGKILLCGSFTELNGVPISRVARLLPDGALDPSFDIGPGPNSTVENVLDQPNGKILISGSFVEFDNRFQGRMARLMPNGDLDPSFDIGTGLDHAVDEMILADNGDIILAGSFDEYNEMWCSNVLRIGPNGELSDCIYTGIGTDEDVFTLLLDNDGILWVGGEFELFNNAQRWKLARLDPYGELQPAVVGTGATNYIYCLELQSDGKVLIAGAFKHFNSTDAPHLTRLNSDGSVDPTFNIGSGPDRYIRDIAVQPDGKILVVGDFDEFNGVPRVGVARLDPYGSLDVTFDPGDGANDDVHCVAIQPDGKILIAGEFTHYDGTYRQRIARLNVDGSLDATFDATVGDDVDAIAIQTDGKILIGGRFIWQCGNDFLSRLEADGSCDPTFNLGILFEEEVDCIEIQPDGKIVVGGHLGWFTDDIANLTRININGTLDSAFNDHSNLLNSVVYSVAIQPDAKIVIAGNFSMYDATPRKHIARLNADGTLDPSFDPDTGIDNANNDLRLQSDGNIVVGGSLRNYNGVKKNYIIRVVGN